MYTSLRDKKHEVLLEVKQIEVLYQFSNYTETCIFIRFIIYEKHMYSRNKSWYPEKEIESKGICSKQNVVVLHERITWLKFSLFFK